MSRHAGIVRFVALAGMLVLVAAGCGGGGSAGGSGGKKILRIGTTYYIDTLNPLVGIETQDDTAYGMVFPQLVQYGPGPEAPGRLGEELDAQRRTGWRGRSTCGAAGSGRTGCR